MKRLEWIAGPDRQEPLPAWNYDHPYTAHLGDRDAVLRRSAAAYLKSLIYDRAGPHLRRGEHDGVRPARSPSTSPATPTPALPGGVGEFFLDFWLPQTEAHDAVAGRAHRRHRDGQLPCR